jgi:DNA-binding NtrC family response regulator
MALLVEYPWPGNIRELENVIQRTVILNDDDVTRPEHLPDVLQQARFPGEGDVLGTISFEDQLQEYKVKIAKTAIEECRGNKTLAARSLRISRTYLHRLIREPLEEGGMQVA